MVQALSHCNFLIEPNQACRDGPGNADDSSGPLLASGHLHTVLAPGAKGCVTSARHLHSLVLHVTVHVACTGIGFAKTVRGNVELMCGLEKVQAQLQGPLQGMPLLVGPSRKGFLGKLTGTELPSYRSMYPVLTQDNQLCDKLHPALSTAGSIFCSNCPRQVPSCKHTQHCMSAYRKRGSDLKLIMPYTS